MPNYFIIGGDGKQYGPVTGDDLRKWAAEGRLNAQSQARGESDTEWRPLSAFPEFADLFGAAPAPTVPPVQFAPDAAGARQEALRKVKGPAVALIVTAILDLVFALIGLVERIFFRPNLQQFNAIVRQYDSLFQQSNAPQMQQMMHQVLHLVYGPLGIVSDLFGVALSLLILIGSIKMLSLRSYEFSMAAAIVAMLPCVTSCCLIGLPFGIWALMVLAKPEVKSHFS